MIHTLWLLIGCASPEISVVGVCLPLVESLRPADGSDEIPTDARLLAVLNQASEDCQALEVFFEIYTEEDDEPIESNQATSHAGSGLVDLELQDELAPLTTHSLFVDDEFNNQTLESVFTTGEHRAELYEDPPIVSVDAVLSNGAPERGENYSWTATLSIDHAPSSAGLSLLHLAGGESIANDLGTAPANADGLLTLDVAFATEDRRGTACFTATQEDEAGRGGDVSDTACDSLPDVERGCSTSGVSTRGRSSTPVWLSLFLLAIARNRRC